MHIKKLCIAALVVVVAFVAGYAIFVCNHDEVDTVVVKDATCTDVGQKEVVCSNCEEVLEVHEIEAHGHQFGEYNIVVLPSKDANGVEERRCVLCGECDTREYICAHNETYSCVARESTCAVCGVEEVACVDCSTVLEEYNLEMLEHQFGEYEVTVPITKDRYGIEARNCEACGLVEERELICGHEHVVRTSYTAATCVQNGEEIYNCAFCEAKIETKTLDKTSCIYSDWKFEKDPTPLEDGILRRRCTVCGDTQEQIYQISMAANSIYVTNLINSQMYVGEFTQSAVDNHSVVYSESAMANGSNNPFVIGHNYGPVGKIDRIKVGQNIYLSVNGNIEVYQVVVSEQATVTNGGTDIVGQSGYSIYDSVGAKTLHVYTCYGVIDGSRWMVLAKLVS